MLDHVEHQHLLAELVDRGDERHEDRREAAAEQRETAVPGRVGLARAVGPGATP